VARRIGRIIAKVALVVMVGLIGLLAVSRVAGYKTLIVRSGSMTGTADIGSVVIARSLDARAVEVGDVILMQRREDGVVHPPVLHRVIESSIDAGDVVVRTKGDANESADPDPFVLRGTTVTPVLVIPRVGFAVSLLQKPAGWFGVVILPTVLFAAAFLNRIWRSDEES